MSLAFPLGLLGLIGIPVLIIIYIIKNKYTEQVISSTYIWTLSEKFLKRRNPINKLVGIISLILQILAVLFVSVAVAQPVFTVPDSAYEYVFILDGSGSMNITEGSRTRFAVAKDEISSLINGSLVGSSYTLVCAGDTTEVVFEQITDKKYAIKKINELDEKYLDTGYAGAIDYAQQYFDNVSRSAKNYLFTDKNVITYENVQIVNVVKNTAAKNFALESVEAKVTGDKTVVTGKVVSYHGVDTVDLNLKVYVDGETLLEKSVGVNVAAAEGLTYPEGLFREEFDASSFNYVQADVTDGDALGLDNSVTVYSPEAENNYSVLLVSDYPGMLNNALSVRTNISTTVIKPAEYSAAYSGYDLYVFDGAAIEELPRDGAVWLFNPKSNAKGMGFNIKDSDPVVFEEGMRLTYSPWNDSALEILKKNLPVNDILVKEYVKCGFTRRFSTLLTLNGDPVVFAGTSTDGVREVVTAFDIHKSSLPSLPDFAILIGNYLNYTFPSVFERTTYFAGESVTLNVAANCDSIRVSSPQGKVSYLNTGSEVAELLLTEVGVYRLTVTEGGVERDFYLHSALPLSERDPVAATDEFVITGEPEFKMKNGIYDDLLVWFILIAVLLAADWVVYCYEQYQLR